MHNDWLDLDYTKDLELDVKWKVPFDPIFPGIKPKNKAIHLVYGRKQYRQDVEEAGDDNYAEPDLTTPSPATQLAAVVFEREAVMVA